MKPIIGIVSRYGNENEKDTIMINEEYYLAIKRSGGLAMILPITSDNYTEKHQLSQKEIDDFTVLLKVCNGFLITGGTTWTKYDELICKYAVKNDLPLLGICLGMQLIGNMDNFDSQFDSDQTQYNDSTINHYQAAKKVVHTNIIMPSKLKDIIKKDEIMVNSRHNYHIIKKDHFVVNCYSEDGLIEGIELPNNRFIMGTQWHPESMIDFDEDMLGIFKKLVMESKYLKK